MEESQSERRRERNGRTERGRIEGERWLKSQYHIDEVPIESTQNRLPIFAHYYQGTPGKEMFRNRASSRLLASIIERIFHLKKLRS